MKIVILESLGISEEEMAELKRPFERQGHTFSLYSRTSDITEMIEQVKDAQALIRLRTSPRYKISYRK